MNSDSRSVDTAAIKHFVRGTLGCACTDEVFEHIERREESPGDGLRGLRLQIGGRLLVRVVTPVDAKLTEANLARWFAEGMAERDAAGMNRFRLVLGCHDAAALAPRARDIVDRLVPHDDRVHLHVLESAALAELKMAARS
jgi:hypothetical protein